MIIYRSYIFAGELSLTAEEGINNGAKSSMWLLGGVEDYRTE